MSNAAREMADEFDNARTPTKHLLGPRGRRQGVNKPDVRIAAHTVQGAEPVPEPVSRPRYEAPISRRIKETTTWTSLGTGEVFGSAAEYKAAITTVRAQQIALKRQRMPSEHRAKEELRLENLYLRLKRELYNLLHP